MRNASTSLLDTEYYFDVSNDSFEKALDIFAQFFIKPLLTESCTLREIHVKTLLINLNHT